MWSGRLDFGSRWTVLLNVVTLVVLLWFSWWWVRVWSVPVYSKWMALKVGLTYGIFFVGALLDLKRTTYLFVMSIPISILLFSYVKLHSYVSPTSIMFLGYLSGYVLSSTLRGRFAFSFENVRGKIKPFYPMVGFALILLVSMFFVILKYSGFDLFRPFYRDAIVNVYGNRANEVMIFSVVYMWYYVSGILMVLILCDRFAADGQFLRNAVILFALSSSVAVVLEIISVKTGVSYRFSKPSNIFPQTTAILSFFFLSAAVYFRHVLLRFLFFVLWGVAVVDLLFIGISSRSALLTVALGVALCLYVLLRKKFSRRSVVLTVTVLLGVVSVLLVALPYMQKHGYISYGGMPTLLRKMIASSNNMLCGRGVDMFRSFLWTAAMSMLRDYPLSGVGLHTSVYELHNYTRCANNLIGTGFGHWDFTDMGGQYATFLAELGIIGFVFFIWMWWEFVRMALSLIKKGIFDRELGFLVCISAGVVGNLLYLLFISPNGSFQVGYALWLIIALSMISYNIYAKEFEEDKGVGVWTVILFLLVFALGSFVNLGAKYERLYWGYFFPVAAFGVLSAYLINRWKCSSSCWKKIILIAVVAFMISNVFNLSVGGLSLESEKKRFGWLDSWGFYRWERTSSPIKVFRWTKREAYIEFRKKGKVIVLSFFAPRPDVSASNPLRVDISVNGTPAGTLTITDSKRVYIWRYRIKDAFRIVRVHLRVNRVFVPEKAGISHDSRELGVGVGVVKWLK